MNSYEKMISDLEKKDIIIKEASLKSSANGLYQDGVIAINKKLDTLKEKICILAEEEGHHEKTYGNIQKLDSIENIKQEYKARLYAYEKLINLDILTFYLNEGVTSKYELADALNVTDIFLNEALILYKNKYGNKLLKTKYGQIAFEPNIIFIPNLKLEDL